MLKLVLGFEMPVHDHIMTLRNTLGAHDDVDQLEPRLLSFGFSPRGCHTRLTTAVVAANKMLSHPVEVEFIVHLVRHTEAAIEGARQQLVSHLSALREAERNYPEQVQAASRYTKDCGSSTVRAGGEQLAYPDFMSNEWLDQEEPDFSAIHNGFQYNVIKVKREFHGPETITLPSGERWSISPTSIPMEENKVD